MNLVAIIGGGNYPLSSRAQADKYQGFPIIRLSASALCQLWLRDAFDHVSTTDTSEFGRACAGASACRRGRKVNGVSILLYSIIRIKNSMNQYVFINLMM